MPGGANAQEPKPGPEPGFAVNLSPRPCKWEGDPVEKRTYEAEGWKAPDYERYPGACQRLRFAYGPINVKPGQNDVNIEPVTIQKPAQDGYITRFRPNLVRPDGTVPPVEQIHLHHGAWFAEPGYGNTIAPFYAAGEEKTVGSYPRGYGMPVKATDAWGLLYMVHAAIQQPMQVYITYDVDFIPKAKAAAFDIKDAYPMWLDVRPAGYSVFNVQRDFGGAEHTCTWPRQECAEHDPFGKTFVGQGEPGNGVGTDFQLPAAGRPLGRESKFEGGTLIGIGGHLHPGGIENEVDLVRPGGENVQRRVTARTCGSVKRRPARRRGRRARRRGSARRRTAARPAARKKRRHARTRRCTTRVRTVTERRDQVRIYNGRALYWDHRDHSKAGGPPTSWDYSMRVNSLPRWSVRVRPGDVIRSNVTYDTSYQSEYEVMGVSIALLVPDKPDGTPQAPGIDPFQARSDTSLGCQSGGLKASPATLCVTGDPTHGHQKENGNYSGPQGSWGNPRRGAPTSDVSVVDFVYQPGDLSMISMTGVPTVKLGTDLRFENLDGGLVYHTVTSCAFPCLGPTGADFPLADGRTSSGRTVDFDSSEMGIGMPTFGPTKQGLDYELPVTSDRGFRPGDVVTYFCRIHPGMRGAFEVTEK